MDDRSPANPCQNIAKNGNHVHKPVQNQSDDSIQKSSERSIPSKSIFLGDRILFPKSITQKARLRKAEHKKRKDLKNCNLNDRINKIDMVCRYNRINRIDQARKNQTALNQVRLTSFVQFWFFLVLDIDSNAVRIKNTVQTSLFLIGNKLVYTVFV